MKKSDKSLIHYIHNFKFNSVFARNLIIVFIAMVLPLAVVSSAFFYNTRKSVNKEISVISGSNVSTIQSVTDTIIHTTDVLAVQTSINTDVQSFCLPLFRDPVDITAIYQRIRTYISNYTNIYPYINSIYVYSEEKGMVIDNQQILSLPDHNDTNWYKYYRDSSQEATMIIPRKKHGRYPSLVSVIKPIYIEGVGRTGCVVINLDVEELNEIISSVEESMLNNTIIFDKNGTILLCSDIKKTNTSLEKYLGISAEKLNPNTEKIKMGNETYRYALKSSSYYDFTYMLLIPQSYFSSIMSQSVILLFLIYFLIFLIGIAVSVVASIKISNPIHNITELLMPVKAIESQEESGNEIVFITNTIKSIIDKTDALSEELNYRLLLLKDAQTYALQAQINPHFMNNTLEAINWSAVGSLGENNKISQMIKSLSRLLDISLNSDHFLIPIEEELQHANIYTYIISLNYGSDINFVWDIEEGISQCRIIKLSLQPILENAIIHGINPNRGKGTVTVCGRFHEDGILFTITDDGVGMSAEEKNKLQSELKENSLSGKCIGIKNVNQRIKLIFGEKYGLNIQSQKGVGTTVELFIPQTDL